MKEIFISFLESYLHGELMSQLYPGKVLLYLKFKAEFSTGFLAIMDQKGTAF